ncbi:glycosyltransferase family 2 protein [Bifidobacterium sp.]|jgi:GT2 family glycosyltransferase|uniref:glycosyltransferase family 2 protein n=1 Tax=Bifidobacterium sp. TaxID=41200 RepID=UPI0025B852CB|nr:glycosyltransferase family 2 protein [Bifidobacterium sp.]MCI1635890.1 glycosyltransferase family 2 protein [Bifidobacterium sp.]
MSFVASAPSDVQRELTSILAQEPSMHRQEVEDSVAAVITVGADLRYFRKTVEAVLKQRVLPAVIVIADCSGQTTEPLYSAVEVMTPSSTHKGGFPHVKTLQVQVVRAKGATSFGGAIEKALAYANLPQQVRALWLLHDDSRPRDVNCLDVLVEAWRNAPGASLLGAKQVAWDGDGLHDVGKYSGRHQTVSLVVDGEPDQEQYDARQDVFAVSLAGALLPLATLKKLSGIDSWFTTFGESADFCRRVCLSGGRVLVVPSAVIAHRRARFEGLRDRAGEGIDEEYPISSAMLVADAHTKYRYTDSNMSLWPVMWIASVFTAFGMFFMLMFRKAPYEAWCEFWQPWRMLARFPQAMQARRRLTSHTVVSLKKLHMLQASRQQIARWRERSNAFERQGTVPLLSPLAKAHLKVQLRRRALWALAMVAIAAGVEIAVLWDVFRGVFLGGALRSDALLPTASTWGQVAQAATTSWSYAVGIGVPATSAPYLLLLLVGGVFTAGSMSAVIAVLLFASAPVMALSFWALAGTVTRSNPVRAVAGLLWCAVAWAFGLYANGNIGMLVVMMFLPVSIAFTLRAVGMYRTEDPNTPHSSIQCAALAALCFIPIVTAEPQLVLALVVIFMFFLVAVRQHRMMLLLIPLPSAFAIAPTLVNVVHYFNDGAWRQLFGDMLVPTSSLNGTPQATSLGEVLTRTLLSGRTSSAMLLDESVINLILLSSLVLMAIIAVCALVLPFALRITRMFWAMALCGILLSLLSTRVMIALDSQGAVAGSALPGLSLIALGILGCVCVMSGGAVRPFVLLKGAGASHTPQIESGSHFPMVIMRIGRALLTVVMAACVVFWGAFGIMHTRSDGSLTIQNTGLPMVGIDYMQQHNGHRILALEAQSENHVNFSVMRTAKGDLVDNNPAVWAMLASGYKDQATQTLATASAHLLSNADADSITALEKLGFGGIFVVADNTDTASSSDRTASESLVSNITASDGTQAVVSTVNGTYFRLTSDDTADQQIGLSGEQQAAANPWRYAWMWCFGIISVTYCLVALPRIQRLRRK